MKKSLSWVVLLAMVFLIEACKKDDPTPPPAIVGTWARANYKFTDLPTGFTGWEGITQQTFGETNYTLNVKSDGTYSRSFLAGDPYNLNDKGKWTLDGTTFKLAADNASDLDLIEKLGIPGDQFTVVGDITDVRLQLSRVVTIGLASDADIKTYGGDPNNVPDSLWQGVDVNLVYVFNKLN